MPCNGEPEGYPRYKYLGNNWVELKVSLIIMYTAMPGMQQHVINVRMCNECRVALFDCYQVKDLKMLFSKLSG